MLNTSFKRDNTICIVSDNVPMSGAKWYAVKVQYNPANDEWRLFTRHDVGSGFDPTTLGSSDGKGANIDATYTSEWLSYMGLYTSMEPTSPNKSVRLKRLKIKKNVELIATPAGTGCCNSVEALPVILKNMELNCQNEAIEIKWTTVTEYNNDLFLIERSKDGVDFNVIGTIKGAVFSGEDLDYSFSDSDPERGQSYYRLSQTDYDGKKTILGTLSTEWPCKGQESEPYLFPNPANDEFNIIFNNKGRNSYRIEVFNNLGQSVIQPLSGEFQGAGQHMTK